MTRFLVIAAIGLTGCFELSFSDDPHVITDLSILAIHTEPPEMRPDTPLTVEVLYADPKGGGRPVRTAWRLRHYRNDNTSTPVNVSVTAPEPNTATALTFAPPETLPGVKRTDDVSGLLDVFLCRDDRLDTAAINTFTAVTLLKTLCTKGAFALGTKRIKAETLFVGVDVLGIDLALEPSIEVSWKQHNPRIDTLRMDGTSLTPVEAGGSTYALCPNRDACARFVPIQVDLVKESVDSLTVPAGWALPDGGAPSLVSLIDAGSDDIPGELVYNEMHRIDWYVTGGTLSSVTSYLPIATEPGGASADLAGFNRNHIDFKGPYQTYWRPPDGTGYEEITLYVVVRDERGGNGFGTYRIGLGTRPESQQHQRSEPLL